MDLHFDKPNVEIGINTFETASIICPFAFNSNFRYFGAKSIPMKSQLTSILALFFTFLFGCDEFKNAELTHEEVLNSVKTITTSFVSHQSDTRHKDDKIIAVASFYPDGTLEEMTQFMTYPYNFKEPKQKKFWTNPDRENLPLVMDGLDFENAERNLLYGNDWPRLFAEFAKSGNHPDLQHPKEFDAMSGITINYGESGLPTLVENTGEMVRGEDKNNSYHISGYSKIFEYENGKVIKAGNKTIPSKALMEAMHKARNEALKKAGIPAQKPINYDTYFYEIYQYDGENLSIYKFKDHEYQFHYENNVLVKSEFYINNIRYNQRIYQYNEIGLITKTEIYNMNNQPEYTINYVYEYFEG